MNKRYSLFTFLLFISSFTSSAQFYTQYFDGADTIYNSSINIEIDSTGFNVWQIATPHKVIFNGPSTVPNAIVTDTVNYYPENNISTFRVRILNEWAPWGVLAVQWKQKIDLDTNYDGAIVEFSTDQGVTWQNAFNNPYVYNFYGFLTDNQDTLVTGEYAFSGTDTTWRDVWLCFDLSWMSLFPDTLHFRFTLKSDGIQNEKEGWLIDNMMANMTMIHTVKNVKLTSYLTAYPNPTTGILHIEAEKRTDFHIIEQMDLINSDGQTVKQWKNLPTKFWFDTGPFAEGKYLLKVKTNIRTETLPVIICRN